MVKQNWRSLPLNSRLLKFRLNLNKHLRKLKRPMWSRLSQMPRLQQVRKRARLLSKDLGINLPLKVDHGLARFAMSITLRM